MRRFVRTGVLVCVMLGCTLSLANAQYSLTAKYQQVPGGYKYYLTAYNNTNPTDGLYVWAVEARLSGATSLDIPAGWEPGSHTGGWYVIWATSWGRGIAPGKSKSGFNVTTFRVNGKALGMGERDGFVKILADPKYGEILGAHIIGPHATDLLHEIVIGMDAEATIDVIARAVHAHPSLTEVVKEAALDVEGEAIHKI